MTRFAGDVSITLVGPAVLDHEAGAEFVDPGATGSDFVDGDVTASLTVSGTLDVRLPGSYTLKYTVRNSGGARATTKRVVTVSDTVDGCTPSPCLHGTCSDAVESFNCACDAAWTGTKCDEPRPGGFLQRR